MRTRRPDALLNDVTWCSQSATWQADRHNGMRQPRLLLRNETRAKALKSRANANPRPCPGFAIAPFRVDPVADVAREPSPRDAALDAERSKDQRKRCESQWATSSLNQLIFAENNRIAHPDDRLDGRCRLDSHGLREDCGQYGKRHNQNSKLTT